MRRTDSYAPSEATGVALASVGISHLALAVCFLVIVGGLTDIRAQPSGNYTIPSGSYSETQNLRQIVDDEFGKAAQIADWSKLKSQVRFSTIRGWAERIGLDTGDGIYVQRGGERWASERRHSFLARHDGEKPGNFLAHDQMGTYALSLGARYDMEKPILVNVADVESGSGGNRSETQYDGDGSGRSASCSTVTIPESWTATEAGTNGRSHRLRGQTYRVRQYLAPDLLQEAETTSGSSALVPIPTRAQAPSRLQADEPIGRRDELVAVQSHYMNVNNNLLSVQGPNKWAARAADWKQQRLNIYDPQTGKVASGLILGGKLLASIGASMATADLTGLSSVSASATDFAISLGSTTLSYYQAVTATPRDKSLAPAMAALADLDPQYREKVMQVQGSREYLNRYFEASSEATDVANSLKFAASEWKDVASAVENYQASQDPVLVNTPAGKQALTNAHDFMGAALASAGLTVAEEIVFRDVQQLTDGFNKLIYTANLYTTVLEAYAHQLDTELRRLKDPNSFNSWSAYSEALAQYQYRVGRYHEVKLGLVTNMYEYAKKLNNTSGLGMGVLPSFSSLSVPDGAVDTYRNLRKRQRKTYSQVIEEVTQQMRVIDLSEARYPDFAREACRSGERGFSGGPDVSNYSIEAREQKVIARSEKGIEWRYATKRPDPSLATRKGGIAYVIDGESYRTEASHVYALNIATGNPLWMKEIGDYTRAGLITIQNGTVLVSHSSGIYALDAESGEQIWRYKEFSDGATSFSVAKSILLFLDGQPVSAHEAMGARSSSTLYALDLKTGRRLWSKELVSESQESPLQHADYEVDGGSVIAENTRVGRTYRLDLKTGKKLQDSGPARCSSEGVKKIAESAFGAFMPSDLSPDVAVDLNGDGVEERFYQQLGTNSQGQIKVIAVGGTAPCRQILSTIVYSSDWTEDFTVLDQRRNGYRLIGIGGITHAFDGERYTQAD